MRRARVCPCVGLSVPYFFKVKAIAQIMQRILSRQRAAAASVLSYDRREEDRHGLVNLAILTLNSPKTEFLLIGLAKINNSSLTTTHSA